MRVVRHLLIAALAAAAASVPGAAASPFGPGERMTFEVAWFGIHAGKVQVTVGAATPLRGDRVWPIVLFARTESLFAVYPVRDRFVTFWVPGARHTLGSDFWADEGGRRRRLKVDLDHVNARARIVRDFEDAPGSDEVWPVKPGSLDMCAMMYALREHPLAVGDEIEMPVFTGRVAFALRARVEAEEPVTVPAGTFTARRMSLITDFHGGFRATGDLRVWVTADERRVPLRVDAALALGTLRGQLVEYQRGLSEQRAGASETRP